MPDLATRGTADRPGLAHAERREVVVQVVLARVRVRVQPVFHLLVVAGAQVRGYQRLGLATREQRGAVGTGEEPHLDT